MCGIWGSARRFLVSSKQNPIAADPHSQCPFPVSPVTCSSQCVLLVTFLAFVRFHVDCAQRIHAVGKASSARQIGLTRASHPPSCDLVRLSPPRAVTSETVFFQVTTDRSFFQAFQAFLQLRHIGTVTIYTSLVMVTFKTCRIGYCQGQALGTRPDILLWSCECSQCLQLQLQACTTSVAA